MSKYIKLEDALKAVRDNTMPLDCWHIDRMRAIRDLPTIEVSEDAISRDYVRLIESDEDAYYGDWNEKYERGFLDAINKVLDAPSVIPQPKEGEWLLDGRCSNCLQVPLTTHKTYCPNCGAKMKGAKR